jgi:hypothetical protein
LETLWVDQPVSWNDCCESATSLTAYEHVLRLALTGRSALARSRYVCANHVFPLTAAPRPAAPHPAEHLSLDLQAVSVTLSLWTSGAEVRSVATVAGGCAAVAYDALLSAIVRLGETNLTAATFSAQQRAHFVVAVATTLGVGEARVVVTDVQDASASTYQISRHRHRRRLLQAAAAQGVDVSFEVAVLPTTANSTAARLTASLTNGALGAALVVVGLAPVVTIESVPMAPTITLPSSPPPTPPPSSPPPAAASPTSLSSGSKSDGFSTNFTYGNVRLARLRTHRFPPTRVHLCRAAAHAVARRRA